jgi:DNA modification methylase
VIHHGDCLDVMAAMEPESVDAIVTDPPYGLSFMGKGWDHGVIGAPFAEAMLRVAKPSAYLLAFGGTRTVHRMTVALEDAGWIIRDMLVWAYASGFPKSKASLKPAWEPIVMARKPGPLRDLAIDACRIGWGADKPTQEEWNRAGSSGSVGGNGRIGQLSQGMKDAYAAGKMPVPSGRWPANVILTDPIFDGGVEGVVGGGETTINAASTRGLSAHTYGGGNGFTPATGETVGYGDSGTYSRFFLIPKADRSDREPVLGGLPEVRANPYGEGREGVGQTGHYRNRQNVHPTVKPTELMRHLVRLVTPPGGLVLDPFLGSGTTGLAAEMEGFPWVGIEREAEYVAIAEARLNGTQKGLGLSA